MDQHDSQTTTPRAYSQASPNGATANGRYAEPVLTPGNLAVQAQNGQLAVAPPMVPAAPSATAGLLDKLVRILIHWRMAILAAGHLLIFSAAYWFAFLLRFEFSVPSGMAEVFFRTLPFVLAIKLAIFYKCGHYHGWWRYATFSDLKALLRATLLSLALILIVDYLAFPSQIPRSVVLMDAMGSALLVGSLRSSWRLLCDFHWPGRARSDRTPALMVIPDMDCRILAYQINNNPLSTHRICGLVHTARFGSGRQLGGIPLVGPLDDFAEVAAASPASHVLVVAGSLPGERMRRLMDQCREHQMCLKVIPRSMDSLSGDGRIPLREIDINDLLRREPVKLDTKAIKAQLTGRRVMVTGAGGSIGSEICRQLLRFRPSELILLDHRENSVFLIHRELQPLTAETKLVPAVADILDEPRMRTVFEQYHPEFIYHAAAHKHVGLMELNVGEAVKNNVFGTRTVADLAHEHNVKKFVLISTDKAVNPTSAMGATKQLAERYVQALAQDSATAFVVVRFGNVLGSAGSVVPIFKDQIARGGPITITDERMTRFFMTIPEASQLVLQAGAMGKGGEIFVLEMGRQFPIVDLAKDMIRLAGLPPDAISIEFVGIRPGEKLYEELYFDEEETLPTGHPKVHAARHRFYSVNDVHDTL